MGRSGGERRRREAVPLSCGLLSYCGGFPWIRDEDYTPNTRRLCLTRRVNDQTCVATDTHEIEGPPVRKGEATMISYSSLQNYCDRARSDAGYTGPLIRIYRLLRQRGSGGVRLRSKGRSEGGRWGDVGRVERGGYCTEGVSGWLEGGGRRCFLGGVALRSTRGGCGGRGISTNRLRTGRGANSRGTSSPFTYNPCSSS
jgi:hypothetical protein